MSLAETDSHELPDVPRFIVSLAAIVLGEADKLVRIPIAKIGKYFKGKTKFSITKQDIRDMSENFGKRGNGEVMIDYEHASEFPEVAAGGPIPAAGWIRSVEPDVDKDGVAWGEADFNAKAREMIAAREYKYGSPSIVWGARDKSNGEQQGATLSSFALTNTPFLDAMPAIRLSDAGWTEKGEETPMAKEPVMCSEHPKTPMLCPKCDADQISQLNASEGHQHQGPKVVQLSEVKRDAKGRLDVASIDKDAVVSMTVYRALDAERVVLSEVAEAVRTGKVTPAQREHFEKLALSDIETFRALLPTLKGVDLSERGVAGTGAEAGQSELAQVNAELDAKARAAVKDNPKLQYHEALKLVASENPELGRRHTRLEREAARKNAGGDE